MDRNSIILVSLVILALCLILPYLIESLQRSHRVKALEPHSIRDNIFVPTFDASHFQQQQERLVHAIQRLKRQQGTNCSDWELGECIQLTRTLQNQAELDAANHKVQVDTLTAYKTKWENTCQNWEEDKKFLEARQL